MCCWHVGETSVCCRLLVGHRHVVGVLVRHGLLFRCWCDIDVLLVRCGCVVGMLVRHRCVAGVLVRHGCVVGVLVRHRHVVGVLVRHG